MLRLAIISRAGFTFDNIHAVAKNLIGYVIIKGLTFCNASLRRLAKNDPRRPEGLSVMVSLPSGVRRMHGLHGRVSPQRLARELGGASEHH